jgi:uncharacterized protein YoxC
MTVTGIVLIIIAVVLCLLLLTLIPTLRAVKKTAISLYSLSEMIRQELNPTLRELNMVLGELKTISNGVAEHTDDVRRFMTALGETGDNLHTINRSVGVVTGVLSTTSAWATGARVAGKYLLERYLKKRGGK